MEGKIPALSTVMIGVLLVGFFLAQSPVEADTSCCKDATARNCFLRCRLVPTGCAVRCTCIIISGTECPEDYPNMGKFLNTEAGNEATTQEEYAPEEYPPDNSYG
ncbi:hypothetical protein C5167_007448 [Papaver somniferum]|nr:hypothetical protein C5167_007448 [Papaver somniferum]